MNEGALREVAADFGTPSYVYFMEEVAQRIASLREAFGGRFELSYAMKCNPNPAVLGWFASRVPWLDVSSVGELRGAARAGCPPERMSYTGPGKSDAALREAYLAGIGLVVVESVREADVLSRYACGGGHPQGVLLRVAPVQVPRGFGDRMAGKPTQFGVDEEQAEAAVDRIAALPGVNLAGFHIYSGTQCLEADSLAENYAIFMGLFTRLVRRLGRPVERLVFGSGLGVPYHEGDRPVILATLAGRVNSQLDQLRSDPLLSKVAFVLELGRYLIAEAGVFLTTILECKVSRGITICVCDGGMNHHASAAGRFGQLIPHNYRIHRVPAGDNPTRERYQLVGPLCTSMDIMGREVLLPPVREGDLLAFECSGAYGLTASPHSFISHQPPREVVVVAASTPGGVQFLDASVR